MSHVLSDYTTSIRWYAVRNGSGLVVPGFAAVAVTSVDADGTLVIGQPTANGQFVLINSPAPIPIGNYSAATEDSPIVAYYETGDGTPATGDTWGAGAASWKLRKGNNGFTVGGGASATLQTVTVSRLNQNINTVEYDDASGQIPNVSIFQFAKASFTLTSPATGQALVTPIAVTDTDNFVSPTRKILTSGAALSGGGDLSADRTITLSESPNSASVVGTGRAINTTAPLTGGGDLSADRTVALSTPLAITYGGTNSATALNNGRFIVSSGGAMVESVALTNGQVGIGSTGANPVFGTLTAGANVTITNGAGSITIAATAGASGSTKIYSQTSVQAGDTLDNFGSYTAFASAGTLNASTVAVGDVIDFWAAGVYSTTLATPTSLGMRLKIGTIVVGTALLAAALPTSSANVGWIFRGKATVTTASAAGVVECQGELLVFESGSTNLAFHQSFANVTTIGGIDFTTSKALQVEATMTAATGNKITIRSQVYEQIK